METELLLDNALYQIAEVINVLRNPQLSDEAARVQALQHLEEWITE